MELILKLALLFCTLAIAVAGIYELRAATGSRDSKQRITRTTTAGWITLSAATIAFVLGIAYESLNYREAQSYQSQIEDLSFELSEARAEIERLGSVPIGDIKMSFEIELPLTPSLAEHATDILARIRPAERATGGHPDRNEYTVLGPQAWTASRREVYFQNIRIPMSSPYHPLKVNPTIWEPLNLLVANARAMVEFGFCAADSESLAFTAISQTTAPDTNPYTGLYLYLREDKPGSITTIRVVATDVTVPREHLRSSRREDVSYLDDCDGEYWNVALKIVAPNVDPDAKKPVRELFPDIRVRKASLTMGSLLATNIITYEADPVMLNLNIILAGPGN